MDIAVNFEGFLKNAGSSFEKKGIPSVELLQKGGPRAQRKGPLGNELSEETHVQAKPETLLGRGTPEWRAAG